MPPAYVVTANVNVDPSPVYVLVIYLSDETPPLPVTTKSPSILTEPSTLIRYVELGATPIPICCLPVKVSISIYLHLKQVYGTNLY